MMRVRPLLVFIAAGAALRLFTGVFSVARIGGLSDLLIGTLAGTFFDLVFLGFAVFIYLLLEKFVPGKIVRFAWRTCILFWLLLCVSDILYIHYLGFRSGASSLHLFSFSDIFQKFTPNAVNIAALLLFPLCFFLAGPLSRKTFPEFTGFSLRQKILFMTAALVSTLVYLPMPLNYYSDQISVSKTARQLAINPYYSWINSILYDSSRLPMDTEVAFRFFDLQNKRQQSGKALPVYTVDYSANPPFKNVVLIVMESFGANRCGALNGKKALSPDFDSLCSEGMLYTRCFSCGPRTQFSISSLLYGFPHIMPYNLFRQNKAHKPFDGLITHLSQQGYRSHFLHGGSAGYDDMSSMLLSNDTLQIRDASAIQKWQFKNKWGVDDESFFDFSAEYISRQTRRNFYCLLSMTNHEPFELPADFSSRLKDNSLSNSEKTFLYSDKALGRFIRALKNKGVYDSTLIIITGDHGEYYGPEDPETKLFHVPLLIIDHRLVGKTRHAVSHADVAEYILSQTGYKGCSHLAGRGLVDPGSQNVLFRNLNNEISLVNDTLIYKYNLLNKTLLRVLTDSAVYVTQTHSVKNIEIVNTILSRLTVYQYLFENGLYCAPREKDGK